LRPSDLANWAGTSLEAASEIAGAAQPAARSRPAAANKSKEKQINESKIA
jgi:hypothetical protein